MTSQHQRSEQRRLNDEDEETQKSSVGVSEFHSFVYLVCEIDALPSPFKNRPQRCGIPRVVTYLMQNLIHNISLWKAERRETLTHTLFPACQLVPDALVTSISSLSHHRDPYFGISWPVGLNERQKCSLPFARRWVVDVFTDPAARRLPQMLREAARCRLR